MTERLERLRAVARDARLSPGDKLTAYALAMIEHTHEMADPASKIGELVATITRDRLSLILGKISIHHLLIAEILSAEIDSGEFEVDDVIEIARDIYSAFAVVDVPLFIGLFDREEFERRARGVNALIRAGLGKDEASQATEISRRIFSTPVAVL